MVNAQNSATADQDYALSRLRWAFSHNVNQTKIKHLDKLFKKTLESGQAKRAFRLHYTKRGDLFRVVPLKFNGLSRWTKWYLQLFSTQSEYIKACTKHRAMYTAAYIRGNYAEALTVLESFEQKYGETLWSITSKLKTYCSSNEKRKAADFLRELGCNKYLAQICDRFFAKFQLENTGKFTTKLQGDLREYRSGGDETNANTLSFLLMHPAYDVERNPYDGFSITSSLSVFDQYIYHRLILSEILVNCNAESFAIINDYLVDLSKVIDEDDLKCCVKRLNGKSEYSPDQIEVLKQYTEGKYSSCSNMILEMLKQSTNGVEFFEILAKCYLRNGEGYPSGDGELIRLVSLFSSALTVDSKCSEYLSEIENILMKNYPEAWTLPVYSQLFNLFKNYPGEKLTLSTRMNYYSGQLLTPRVATIAENLNKIISDSLSATLQYAVESNVPIDAPGYRVAKYNLLKHINQGDCSAIDEVVSGVQKFKSSFLPYELEELMVEYYICNKEIVKALNIVADCCIDNIEAHRCFSLRHLIAMLNGNVDRSTIYKPIVLHIYNKKIGNDFADELKYAYDDFMRAHNEFLPSELFRGKTLSKYDKYFLLHVCTLSTMSISLSFENSIELQSERIRILDLLIINNAQESNHGLISTLLKERASVVEGMVIDQGKLKFDASKIYVDVDGFVQEKRDDFERLYNAYVQEKNSQTKDVAIAQLDQALFKVESTDSPLLKLIDSFLNEFAKNPNYGLDKALSTELRHGVFSTLIRSRFESYNLVTPYEKNQGYAKNDFWSARFEIFTEAYINYLNAVLAKFSGRLDAIIVEASEWLKVTFDQNDGKRVFNFNTQIFDLLGYKAKLSRCNDVQAALAILTDLAWEKLDSCIKVLLDRIDTRFKNEINDALTDLIHDLKSKFAEGQLTQLLDTISKAKNEFVQDIQTISEWLTVSKDLEIDPLQIGAIIKIAQESIFQIKRSRDIKYKLGATAFDLFHTLSGRESKAVCTSLITAFENAIRHGDSGDSTEITINVMTYDGNEFEIHVINKMRKFPTLDDKASFFDSISKRMRSSENIQLMRREGGSGLYKIKHLLRAANPRFDAVVKELPDDSFGLYIAGVYHEHSHG